MRPHLCTSPPQKQGLEWMHRRERTQDAVGRGLLQLHPAWVQLVTASRFVFYVRRYGGGEGTGWRRGDWLKQSCCCALFHGGIRPSPTGLACRVSKTVITTRFLSNPLGGTCGGFLCDEMVSGCTQQQPRSGICCDRLSCVFGDDPSSASHHLACIIRSFVQGLGKTLQMLMLVLSNPAPPGDRPNNGRSCLPAHQGSSGCVPVGLPSLLALMGLAPRSAGWQGNPESYEQDSLDPCPIGTTLVVIPSNLMGQWLAEVAKHVKPGWVPCMDGSALTGCPVVSHLPGRVRGISAARLMHSPPARL